MHIPRRDGHDPLNDRHARDVAARSEVHGRAHGTVLVHTHQVLGRRYRRRPLREELACDVSVLDGDRLGVFADNVRVCRLREVGFGTADGGFGEGHAVDMFGLCLGNGEGGFSRRGGEGKACRGGAAGVDGRGGGDVAGDADEIVDAAAEHFEGGDRGEEEDVEFVGGGAFVGGRGGYRGDDSRVICGIGRCGWF